MLTLGLHYTIINAHLEHRPASLRAVFVAKRPWIKDWKPWQQLPATPSIFKPLSLSDYLIIVQHPYMVNTLENEASTSKIGYRALCTKSTAMSGSYKQYLPKINLWLANPNKCSRSKNELSFTRGDWALFRSTALTFDETTTKDKSWFLLVLSLTSWSVTCWSSLLFSNCFSEHLNIRQLSISDFPNKLPHTPTRNPHFLRDSCQRPLAREQAHSVAHTVPQASGLNY